jgi:hypothetical protein
LKVLFADLLGEKNTVEWLTDSADTLKQTWLPLRNRNRLFQNRESNENASTIWGGVFSIVTRKNYLLHPTSFGFESRATHMENRKEQSEF